MKRVMIVLLLAPLFVLSQENTDTLSFNYTGIATVDSATAKVLMSRAKLFVAENFKSAKDVIQLDDAESNTLVVKGNLVPIVKIPLLGKDEYGHVNFTMKIQAKDGKYKYTFSDFSHEAFGRNQGSGGPLINPKPACGTFVMSKSYWHQIKDYSNKEVIAFIFNLNKQMTSSSVAKKDDF